MELTYRNILEEQAQQWVRASNLALFIKACEEDMKRQGIDLSANTWEVNWLAWARQHANRINPLLNGFVEEQKAKRPELESL